MDKKLSDEQKEICILVEQKFQVQANFFNEKRKGVYVTADKELPVFKSEHKYEFRTAGLAFMKLIMKT